MLQSNFEGHDEPSQMAAYLSECAQKFLQAEQVQVLPALRCLYAAAALVLPAQFEAEIRLQLGNVLLDHTQNSQEALNQLQKAHHLALSVRKLRTYSVFIFSSQLVLSSLMTSVA